jgi:hypothetical protein
MAMKLTTIDDLQNYFKGVVARAQHHAQNVDEIIYPLLGMIIRYKDNGTDITVWGKNGSSGNILWAIINGTRYAFRYEHTTFSVEIREKNHNGNVKSSITNNFTLNQLKNIFNSL